MNGWITLSTKISLLLTFISSATLLIKITMPYIFQDVEMSLNASLVIFYLALICFQTASTHLTSYLSNEKKVVRSFILAITFALPWFLLYAKQS